MDANAVEQTGIVFRGGLSACERDATLTALRSAEPVDRLVVATGRHLGEKHDVLVVDYVEFGVPMLARMVAKHQTGYLNLGVGCQSGCSRRQIRLKDELSLGYNPSVDLYRNTLQFPGVFKPVTWWGAT